MRKNCSLLAIASLLFFVSARTWANWPMAGGNPARTSWCDEEVTGNLDIEWYVPIEPYISQKVQVVATEGQVFLATSRGLYAFDAVDGSTDWVFPTNVPLGHSPAVDNGTVYVGGFDRNLYAINAETGALVWKFTGGAGFQNNPLVVNGVVYVGCRDGKLHAIAAAGTANEGEEIWAQPFQAGGPILFSPAYADGTLYIAANDACVYAIDAAAGTQLWKSSKLPTGAFQSWWPVLTDDYVLLYGAENYSISNRGGLSSQFIRVQFRYDIFNDPDPPDGSLNGEVPGVRVSPTPAWANGNTVYDFSLANTGAGAIAVTSDYFESKPWRRSFFVLNRATGSEVTYDFDGDGNTEYAPIVLAHTHGGNAHPPLVAPDGIIYSFAGYKHNGSYIPRGGLLGWKVDTPYMMAIGHDRAIDEPVAAAGGGKLIYNTLCCNRTGGATSTNGGGGGSYWGYGLYDSMPDLWDYYRLTSTDPTGPTITYGTHNGVYGLHGDNNPPVPYNGKVYVHRMNHLLCLSSTGGRVKLPEAKTQSVPAEDTTLTLDDIRGRLEVEVDKMIAAGHLRPGYFPMGIIDSTSPHAGDDPLDYFHEPGETIRVLCRALPHLPAAKQASLRSYIQSEFNAFPPYSYVHIGWNSGAKREAFDTPPEAQSFMNNFGPRTRWEWWSALECWHKPPQANYAMYKYAQVFGNAAAMLANKVDMFTDMPDNNFFNRRPYILNAYIAGFYGLKGLYELAGQAVPTNVSTELTRLLNLRVNNWNKDRATIGGTSLLSRYQQGYGIVWNLMFMVPELGQYLHDNLLNQVQTAMKEYETVAPMWFVARAEAGYGEDGFALLQHYHGMMQAKALILQEPYEELVKWLDIGAFEVGDLYYINNLVSVLESGNRPKARFSTVPEPAVGDVPLSVSFDASDSNDPDGSIVSYEWDFGDGANDVGVTTSHQYTNSGVYPVMLTITDNNGLSGQTTGDVIVTVNGDLPPEARFEADPLTGIAPLEVSFDASISEDPYGTIVSYAWDFNDGSPPGNGVTVNHTFTDPGSYAVTLTVTDDGGLTDISTVTITGDAPPPPIELPGRLEAEDYKLGGEGVGYHDTTTGNSGSATEYSDDIDIGNCDDGGAGFNIGYISAGEWVAYDVNFAQAGVYDITLRVATAEGSDKRVRIELDGVNISGGTFAFNTGGAGWTTYQDSTIAGSEMPAGVHELKVYMDDGNFNLNYLHFAYVGVGVNRAPEVDAGTNQSVTLPANTVNLNGTVTDDGLPDPPAAVSTTWSVDSGPGTVNFADSNSVDTAAAFSVTGVYVLRLTANDGELEASDTVCVTVKPEAGAGHVIPGRVEVEYYKEGGEGVGYHDTTSGNATGIPEFTDDVDVGNCPEGGFNIGYINSGEWTAYGVTVDKSGEYTVTARVATDWAGTRTIRVTMGGTDVSGPISFTTDAGGGWGTYFDVNVPGVALAVGDYEMRVEMESGDFNLNYVDIFLTGDINRDGQVDHLDLSGLAQHWLWTGTPGDVTADLVADGVVSLLDFALLAAQWTVPYVSVDINKDGSVDYHDLKCLGDNWLWSGVPGGIPEDIFVDGSVNLMDMARIAVDWLK